MIRTLPGFATAALLLVALFLAAIALPAAAMTLFEATERLAFERESAVACARVAKRLLPEGDAEAYSRAELGYEAARAEFTAAIAGLEVALITGDESETQTLSAVSRRLRRGAARREAFCAEAVALLPPAAGERSRFEALVELGGGLIEAAEALLDRRTTLDEERRGNLRSALESARWPGFGEI